MEPGRLRWQCRRGMMELDVMLTRCVDEGLGVEELRTFERLLKHSDDELWDWFTGRRAPNDEAMDGLVRKIRALKST